MKLFKIITASVLLSLILVYPEVEAQKVEFGAGLSYGIPMGDFSDALESDPVGGNFYVTFPAGKLPFDIGVELGIMTYGDDSRKENFNSQIPDVQVEVFRSYNIMTGNLLVRYQIDAGRITPYIDGLAGFNYMFTKTSVRQSDNTAALASSVNRDDAALNYGGGLGVKFDVFKIANKQVRMNINGRYLFSDEITYLNDGELIVQNGTVAENTTTSDTDLIVVNVGLSVSF
ncbi:hypothetical protein AB2B38_005310 [Balneola sp. MJW-20]|uniref:hypothetical protein n=1 Tax=Gracilimonas aurantiaca TaxID=3234185 RepID=UPI0034672732